VDKQGEEVCAVIVPDCEEINACYEMPTGKPDMDKVREVIAEVVSCVNAQMADYKRISNFDIQLEELEKTSTRKVKRFLYE
jgi:ribulose bisphosphate carboxylase small subunit